MGSFNPRMFNTDGTRNVYCRKCLRKIGSITQGNFGSVNMCAICYAAETGEDLSPEVQDGLEGNVRLSNGFMVPRNVVRPTVDDIPPDPVDGKEAKVGFGSYFTRVLKAAVFGAIKAGKSVPKEEPVSKQLARQKRRSRVFAVEDMQSDVVDLNQSIPTITLGDEIK